MQMEPIETEEQFDRRPIIISAIVVALLIAVGAWYFLIYRPAEKLEPTPTPEPTDLIQEFPPQGIIEVPPTESPAVAGVAETPNPGVGVMTPTGAPAWIIVVSIMALLGGYFSIRSAGRA